MDQIKTTYLKGLDFYVFKAMVIFHGHIDMLTNGIDHDINEKLLGKKKNSYQVVVVVGH